MKKKRILKILKTQFEFSDEDYKKIMKDGGSIRMVPGSFESPIPVVMEREGEWVVIPNGKENDEKETRTTL